MGQEQRFAAALRAAAIAGLLTPAVLRGGEARLRPRAYDIETFDTGAVEEAARTGAPVDLRYFGKSHRMVLEPSEVRSADFREASGSLGALRTVYTSAAKTLKGRLLGEPESIVRFTVGRTGLRGLVRSSEGWAFIEPEAPPGSSAALAPAAAGPGATAAPHRVFTEGDIDPHFLGLCAEPVQLDTGGSAPGSGGATPPGTTGADLRVFELAVDADTEFFAIYGADSTAEIESVINMVDGIYETELGLTIQLASVNVWESEPDPYSSTDSGALLGELRSYWNAEHDGISRDAAHLFTGKELDGSTVGIAYVSVVCSSSVAYGLSQDLGSDVLMPILVAHELGHNLGAGHDPSGSSPRYIMYPSLGFLNLDQFSDQSKADIQDYVAGVSCLAFEGGGSNISNPPNNGGGGGGGGGGGPVDPILLGIAAGTLVLHKLGVRKRRHG